MTLARSRATRRYVFPSAYLPDRVERFKAAWRNGFVRVYGGPPTKAHETDLAEISVRGVRYFSLDGAGISGAARILKIKNTFLAWENWLTGAE